jgi:hypothetical protein
LSKAGRRSSVCGTGVSERKDLRATHDIMLEQAHAHLRLHTNAGMSRRESTGASRRGWAVHVENMKPVLKAPGIRRLNNNYDGLLSTFAFNYNLRLYNEGQ